MVAGGYNDYWIASSEIIRHGDGFWTTVGNLPSAVAGLGSVSIDNNIILTGSQLTTARRKYKYL